MARERESLLTLLNKTSEIETLLTTASGIGIPWQKTVLRTINDKTEFVLWKNQLKYQLQIAPQDKLIQETIALLDNGFKNGFTDERDFRELKAKLNLIAEHADRYEIELPDAPPMEKKQSMKKGTIVKTAFDEYSLIEQVGSGGNGRVFSATNGNSDFVAIKFVERNIPANKLKRFKNEIYFCERHGNKNIVEILDRGYVTLDNTEYVFYVMPLYAETLRDKMKVKIKPEDAVTIFVGLIEGLQHAHKLGTIHRDIKPENIMFKAGSLKPIICDFGIAHFAEDELLTIIETKKNDRMANFQYAAPEQRVKGEVATAQTDIYAAALILNEMFTGDIPQAIDYKTIASVAPGYAYLDDVFAQLFKQKAQDRLYPEEKILTEMKVRAEQYNRDQEKLRLQKVVDDAISPDDFNASVMKKEFINGSIVFTLDRELPYEWFQILSGGHLGSYSALMGYGPEKLKKNGRYAISMPVYASESPNSIKAIVENVLDWIPKANAAYSAHIKRVAQQKQREREAARKAEIAKLDRESSVNAILAQI